MTTDNIFDRQQEKKPIIDNPLADIVGKFGGKLWLETLSEIQRSRDINKKEVKKLLNNTDDV